MQFGSSLLRNNPLNSFNTLFAAGPTLAPPASDISEHDFPLWIILIAASPQQQLLKMPRHLMPNSAGIKVNNKIRTCSLFFFFFIKLRRRDILGTCLQSKLDFMSDKLELVLLINID